MSLSAEQIAAFDWPSVSVTSFSKITQATARYEALPDPDTALRRGLIEEVGEIIYAPDNPSTKQTVMTQLTGELGDALWYASELTRRQKLELPDGLGAIPFRALQADTPGYRYSLDFSPWKEYVKTMSGNSVSVPQTLSRRDELIITTLRVADILNPQNPDLWLPAANEKRFVAPVLADYLVAVVRTANNHDIDLADAAYRTAQKLAGRTRRPHVVDEDTLRSSTRRRIAVSRFTQALLLNTYLNEHLVK